jgi:hypothetical protein
MTAKREVALLFVAKTKLVLWFCCNTYNSVRVTGTVRARLRDSPFGKDPCNLRRAVSLGYWLCRGRAGGTADVAHWKTELISKTHRACHNSSSLVLSSRRAHQSIR